MKLARRPIYPFIELLLSFNEEFELPPSPLRVGVCDCYIITSIVVIIIITAQQRDASSFPPRPRCPPRPGWASAAPEAGAARAGAGACAGGDGPLEGTSAPAVRRRAPLEPARQSSEKTRQTKSVRGT